MSARSQVTITLGKSGQVVKRARPISDDDFHTLGGKRSVRERLESNMNNSNSCGGHFENKRQRTEGHAERFIDKNPRDRQVGKDDLRWKLIKKNLSRRRHLVTEGRDIDLRERLSRSIQTSSRSNAREQPKESSASSLGRRIPSARSADDLLELDSHRKSYSVALDKPRNNSPDRLINVPRHMFHSRRYGELQHASGMRSLDASRPSYLTNSLVGDTSRYNNQQPTTKPYPTRWGRLGDTSRSLTYISKTTPVDAARPVVRTPVPGAIVHGSKLGPGEPLTVGDMLKSLGLGKYSILFQAEEVDMTALRQMRDNDLKELGIPMGPRKKILLAVLSHARQQQQQ